MSGGAALWLAAEAREVAAARRRSREGEIAAWGGGRISTGGGGVPFLKVLAGGGIRGGQWGSGDVADAWWKQGTSKGSLLTDEQRPAGSRPKPAGAHDVHRVRTADRTEGEGRG
jgi:hypothetical protein